MKDDSSARRTLPQYCPICGESIDFSSWTAWTDSLLTSDRGEKQDPSEQITTALRNVKTKAKKYCVIMIVLSILSPPIIGAMIGFMWFFVFGTSIVLDWLPSFWPLWPLVAVFCIFFWTGNYLSTSASTIDL